MTKLGLRVTLDSDQVRRFLGSLYFLTCEFSCFNPESVLLWTLGLTRCSFLAFPPLEIHLDVLFDQTLNHLNLGFLT